MMETQTLESKQRFRILFDKSPDPCWIIENRRFVACNQAAVSLLGYRDEGQLLNLHPAMLSPPLQPDGRPSLEKAEAIMDRALRDGILRFEWVHRRADGQCFPVEVTLSKIDFPETSQSENDTLYCVWRDISEQKRMQKESERLQRSIAASVNEVYMFDAETLRITFANGGALRNLGYDVDELKTMTPLDLQNSYASSQFADLLPPLRNGEKIAQHFRATHQRKNGEHYPVDMHLEYCAPQDEAPYFLAIALDISEQQQLEAKMETLLESTSAVIWSTDTELRLDYISRGRHQMLDIESASLIGQQLFDVLESDLFHPDDRPILQDAFSRLISEDRIIEDLQHRIRNADGEWQWVAVSASITRDIDDKFQQMVGLVHDISLQKQVEEKLRNLNQELDIPVKRQVDELRHKDILLQQQARLAAMGEMIGNIAHQWRQPLNTLAIILMDLEDRLINAAAEPLLIKDSMRRCNELLEKMSQTIDDFRYFFRCDKTLVNTELMPIVRESVRLLEPALNHYKINIQIDAPQFPVKAWVCPGELSQALLCLITNAKDQILRRNTSQGKIIIRLYSTPEWAMIEVVDNGGGISEADFPKLFEPYFTRKVDGSGLGLYITRITVEHSMHGKIDVKNGTNGACFTLQLPRFQQQGSS